MRAMSKGDGIVIPIGSKTSCLLQPALSKENAFHSAGEFFIHRILLAGQRDHATEKEYENCVD